jgi:Holliday junction resolvase RusA-like endonuclease
LPSLGDAHLLFQSEDEVTQLVMRVLWLQSIHAAAVVLASEPRWVRKGQNFHGSAFCPAPSIAVLRKTSVRYKEQVYFGVHEEILCRRCKDSSTLLCMSRDKKTPTALDTTPVMEDFSGSRKIIPKPATKGSKKQITDSKQRLVAKEKKVVKKRLSTKGKQKTITAKENDSSLLTSKQKTTKRASTTDKGPLHWRSLDDVVLFKPHGCVVVVDDDDNEPTDIFSNVTGRVAFTVRGNPLPLRRHRTARGFVYNPSAKAQESFRDIISHMVTGFRDELHLLKGTHLPIAAGVPFFPEGQALVMTILFSMKRPNNHFVANRRGMLEDGCRLKATAPSVTSPTRTDVDNLAKFVLDSCNGLLYEDDRQVISLHVTKVLDEQGTCLGSTQVDLRAVRDDEIPLLLNRSFSLL